MAWQVFNGTVGNWYERRHHSPRPTDAPDLTRTGVRSSRVSLRSWSGLGGNPSTITMYSTYLSERWGEFELCRRLGRPFPPGMHYGGRKASTRVFLHFITPHGIRQVPVSATCPLVDGGLYLTYLLRYHCREDGEDGREKPGDDLMMHVLHSLELLAHSHITQVGRYFISC